MFFEFFANHQDIQKTLHLTRSQAELDFGHYRDVTPLFTADWLCQNSIDDIRISPLTWARQFSSSASLVCHNLGEIFSKGQWKCESVCCKKSWISLFSLSFGFHYLNQVFHPTFVCVCSNQSIETLQSFKLRTHSSPWPWSQFNPTFTKQSGTKNSTILPFLWKRINNKMLPIWRQWLRLP